jgi:hypothetical protein
MARQVYFDPFGSYTRGYDSGSQQEQQLQQNVRLARDSDYKYNVLNPLEFNKLQREDTLGANALPYQIKMLPLGFNNALVENQNRNLEQGHALAQYGLIGPQAQNIQRITGYNMVANPEDGTYQFSDANGVPMGGNLGVQQILNANPTFRAETYGRDDKYFDQNVDARQLGVQEFNAQTTRAQAEAYANSAVDKGDAALLKAQGGGNGIPPWMVFNIDAPAGTAGNALFGMGEPQQPQQPQYVQSPRPAQPIPGATNTSEQLVNWMRANNPNAPAMTAADWDNLGPAGQQAYIQQYAPQLKQQLVAPTTVNPADYNPYLTAP